MKRKDIILISVILILALAGFGILQLTRKDGNTVVVTVDGEKVYETVLSEEQVYQIPVNNGKNVLEIRDGAARMKEADCPDQICRKHKEISKSGETIVCLPHKVVIEIQSDMETRELDGITK